MKKPVLIFWSLTSLLLQTVQGQLVNGDFEGWNTQTYSIPIGWQTGNGESISDLGVTPVTQVSGVSGSAVRMETIQVGNDFAQAYITIGDPMSGEGGIPFSQTPTAITGYYRYNLPVNDSALIFVMFKSNGVPISTDVFMIKGTGTQNTFTAFNFPLSVVGTPDSVVIAMASSNLINGVGIEAGSWLEIDDIAFTGTVMNVPNNDFESWNSASFDNIIGWTVNGNVSKTADSHTGTSAVQLVTMDWGNGNVGASYLSNGQNSQNGTVGGIPYSQAGDTLIGYYKFIPSGTDSASIGISLTNNGIGVGGGGRFLPAAATYTYFEIPFGSFSTPDTLRIDVSSSQYPTPPSAVGSTLILDDLQFKSQLSTGVSKVQPDFIKSGVYPNPADNYIYVRLSKPVSGTITLSVFDMEGRIIQSRDYSQREGDMKMNVENLTPGTYFYSITGENYTQSGLFTRN